jgi:DNA-directed RNA polymerase specialized sigma24 family protein
MARRLFDMIDIVEVLQHWYSGRSKTEVAQSLGVDRGTVRKYVAPAETAGMGSVGKTV